MGNRENSFLERYTDCVEETTRELEPIRQENIPLDQRLSAACACFIWWFLRKCKKRGGAG